MSESGLSQPSLPFESWLGDRIPRLEQHAANKVRLLVTVKAYPAVSRKHGEVVCVAGIRTDCRPARWVRLWPIPFRDLSFWQQFKKYQEISVVAEPSASDGRPESMRPLIDSLEAMEEVPAHRGWAARRAIVEPLIVGSMCQVLRLQEQDGTSLAAFRPGVVQDFIIEKQPDSWDPDQQAILDQLHLFKRPRPNLERIPYIFSYRYRCADAGCQGHEQSIIDWEIHEAFRSWRQYGEQKRLQMIRDKWLGELCHPSKDTVFFVGNQHQHPRSFLLLGVFWPPRTKDVVEPKRARQREAKV